MARDLFDAARDSDKSSAPLAERMRPESLGEIMGQDKLLGAGRALRSLIEAGEVPSMILWGPPGSGKTTLARVIAKHVQAAWESVSAVMSGVKELREVVERAGERRKYHRQRTLLFVDEIHRFNKAQQDALLPHVETGLVTLIGATTENPSFEINSALLSRCKVFVLETLGSDALVAVAERALHDPRGLGGKVSAGPEALQALAAASHGDARQALSSLELAVELCRRAGASVLSLAHVEEAAQRKTLLYDKGGDEHYNVVSAFIKSMRGSDPDAAVYWMARMLEAGEEPRFVLRRMVIFASEDVGNADPQALSVAVAALHAFELLGLPEGILPMTHAAIYLACAPKSNAVIKAAFSARDDVRAHGALAVPHQLRNAPTALMRELGYGQAYQYPHDFAGHHVREQYLPDALKGRRYYAPSGEGHERIIGERLAGWRGASQTGEATGAARSDRLAQAIALFDAANGKDPNALQVKGAARPRELVAAERLSAWVTHLAPAASEALRLAARCQHLRRFEKPRDAFPPGRSGYLKWRSTAALFHAEQAAAILAEVGYDEETRAAVRALNLKKGLHKGNADAQVLEDALCLAFMEHELAEFAGKHSRDKVVDILRKTWRKMSARGHSEARKLELPATLSEVLAAALAEERK